MNSLAAIPGPRPAIATTLVWRLAQIKEKHEGAKSNAAHIKRKVNRSYEGGKRPSMVTRDEGVTV
jgi:hypothetical protein